jgi:hypothetical protein
VLLRDLRRVLLGGLCILAGTVEVQAQQAAGILNAFGLFGSWAVECGAPPSPANVVQTVTWTGREPVEYRETIGPGAAANRYRVISARMPDASTLVMQVLLNGRFTENLTITKYGSSAIRTMTNQTWDGFLVENGVIRTTGRPTPWLRKCR